MTRSHLDTVPSGRHLDGALSVLAGLECLRCIKEQRLPTRLPLEAVAFTDEEGRFGSLLSSRAMCGRLTPESNYAARDSAGISLRR
jgi:N-carbamoyl-L-amino-acid hydrolase